MTVIIMVMMERFEAARSAAEESSIYIYIYIVFDEESESEVKKCQFLEPGGKK